MPDPLGGPGPAIPFVFEVNLYLGDQSDWWLGIQEIALDEANAIERARGSLAVAYPAWAAIAVNAPAAARVLRVAGIQDRQRMLARDLLLRKLQRHPPT